MNFLRHLLGNWKFAYTIYNFLHPGRLRKNKAAYKRFGLKKSIFCSIQADDLKHLEGESPWLDQAITDEEIKRKAGFSEFKEEVQEQILQWPETGYMILNSVFSESEVATINQEIERLLNNQKIDWRYGNSKLMFAYRYSDKIQEILNNSPLKKIMDFVLGTEVSLFQSINFHYGSNQKPHSDSVHMSTFPAGYLIAAWMALEDIQEGSGELEYYPGSHRLPYITNNHFNHGGNKWFLGKAPYDGYEAKVQEVIEERELQRQRFLPRKGDVLIWHANLLHGGSPVKNQQQTRKSMVLHYFANQAIAYHEITQRPALRG